jgi:HPt (histidine-containing phosphotransfer) domain-containing protein
MNIHQDDYSSSGENHMVLHQSVPDSVNSAVDIAVLRSLEQAQAEDEPDLIIELIDLYLEHTPRQLTAMSALLMQGDTLSLRRAAHSLKGSSATLGAGHTAALCGALETLTEDISLKAVAGALDELVQEFAYARQAFLIERSRRSSEAFETHR